jgi:hypothetical protein
LGNEKNVKEMNIEKGPMNFIFEGIVLSDGE